MELSENELRITQLAMDKFLERKIQTNLGLEFELELISPYCTYLKKQRQELKTKTAKKYGTLHLWLTINPDEKKTTFEKFRDKVNAVATRAMIDSCLWCFEQRGTTAEDCGKGYHAHMLITRNIDYNQKKIIDNLKNSFKNFTNIQDYHLFNYHWCPEEFYADKIEYMTGVKIGEKEEEKQLKQKIDKLFRQKKNLKEYYKNADEKVLQTQAEKKEPTIQENKEHEFPLPKVDTTHITNCLSKK